MKEPRSVGVCVRDGRGRPVPWINVWSAEMPEARWTVEWDGHVQSRGLFTAGGRGEGTPDFTRQAPQRQRASMAARLCQVCGMAAGESAVLVMSGRISAREVEVDGLGPRVVLTEPWLCEPCGAFAVAVCPGLIRRRRDQDLYVVRPVNPTLVVSRGWVEGPLEAETKAEPTAMWAKLAAERFVDMRGRPIKVRGTVAG